MPFSRWRSPLFIVVVVFAILVSVINPMRDLMTRDDGWAYARSVEHLVNTGEYCLDSWAAANMPVQIYLAAGLAHIFGYSTSLLRISTLLLFLCGAIAFYCLLEDSGIDGSLAAALTLALIASPLVLWLGFTFMTDVQFLGWVLTACWLCARGLRRNSSGLVFLSSLCAALGTGTRQFGIALPVALVFACVIAARHVRFPWRFVLAGIPAPATVFAMQVWAAKDHPSFTQSVRLAEQSLYMSQPPLQIAMQLLWRGTLLIEYSGLFLVALSPALLLLAYSVWRRSRTLPSPDKPWSSQWTGGIQSIWFWNASLVAAHVLNVMRAKGSLVARLKAALLPWVIWELTPYSPDYYIVLSILTIGSATLLSGFLLRPSVVKLLWRSRDPGNCFLAITAFAFAALHLGYVQYQDTYLIIFVPFALIAIGHLIRIEAASARCVRPIAAGSLILGIALAFWMRGDLNKQEAAWHAAEQLHTAGVDTMQVGGNLTWIAYHGAFDKWLIHLGSSVRPYDYAGRLYLFFYWASEKQSEAEYRIYSSDDRALNAEVYEIFGQVPYRDTFLRPRFVYIVKRKHIA